MSLLFLKATLERAAKTFAQTLLALVGGDILNVVSFGWLAAVEIAAGAAVTSVLTSVASARVSGDPDSPSLVPGEST